MISGELTPLVEPPEDAWAHPRSSPVHPIRDTAVDTQRPPTTPATSRPIPLATFDHMPTPTAKESRPTCSMQLTVFTTSP